jgi:hypothetical protein
MVLNLLGQFTNLVGEGQSFFEIAKGIIPFEVVFIDHMPVMAELSVERRQRLAFQWSNSTLARNTFFCRQFTHKNPPSRTDWLKTKPRNEAVNASDPRFANDAQGSDNKFR